MDEENSAHTSFDCITLSNFPNGNTRILTTTIVCGAIAVVFSVWSWALCQFVQVTLQANEIGLLNGKAGLGMFSREGTSQEWEDLFKDSDNDISFYCVPYSSAEFRELSDPAWKAGGAMAVISTIFGIITFVAICSTSCLRCNTTFFKRVGVLFMVSGLFSALSFVWFATDACSQFKCEFSVGAGLTVVACALFFICGFLCIRLKAIPKSDAVLNKSGQPMGIHDPKVTPGTVTVLETITPDGKRKIVKTTVNSDMSETVDETIIERESVELPASTSPVPQHVSEQEFTA